MTIRWMRRHGGAGGRIVPLAVLCTLVALSGPGLIACDGNGSSEPDARPTDDAGPGDTSETSDAADASDVSDVSDTSGPSDTSETSPEPAKLVVEPEEVLFRGVAKGDKKTKELRLRNIGGRELTVEELRVEEHEKVDVADGEFQTKLSGGASFPLTIGPDLVETVQLTYQPADYKADRATLTAVTRGSEVADVETKLRTVVGHPDIRGPELIRFGTVPEGETKRREILLYNRGTERLEISAVEATGDENVSVEFPRRRPTVRLDEGERFIFELVFSAPDTDKRRAQVRVESNDPDQMPFRIDVTANRSEPCMTVNVDAVDFGDIGAGEGTQELGILNCNRERNLTLKAVTMLTDGGGSFALEGTPSFPTTIQPAQQTRMTVAADLDEDRETYGTISIRSDDTDKSPLLIEVRANVGQ